GLSGDDEHGWSDYGVFNFEGGCYAKVIRLSREGEPEIYATTRMFGTVLENVVVDPETRAIDLESAAVTENTRASYPIHFIPNHVPGGMAGHPSHIVFLTCDAYGIMPPIARLSPAQAMYHFLSGYTAKVAGTERGGWIASRPPPSRCSGSKCLCKYPACLRTCCYRAARGATPRRTTPRRRSWPSCSGRTSSSSRTKYTPPCGTPVRRVDGLRGRSRPALEQHPARPRGRRGSRHGRGAAPPLRAPAGPCLPRLSRRHAHSVRARLGCLSPRPARAVPARRGGGRTARARGSRRAQAGRAAARHRPLPLLPRLGGGGAAAPRGAGRAAPRERRAGRAARGTGHAASAAPRTHSQPGPRPAA